MVPSKRTSVLGVFNTWPNRISCPLLWIIFLAAELTMPKSVDLSVSIGVGGCLWLWSLSVVHSGTVVFTLWRSTPSLVSAVYVTTWRSTHNSVWNGPLLIGSLCCLEGSDIELKKKWSPTLIHAFSLIRWETSLYSWVLLLYRVGCFMIFHLFWIKKTSTPP